MSQNDETDNSEATKEEIKNIRAINRDTVHRICSGQVVLNLAIAVKELVENAVDAGATNIEIRLKEYGSECVEVTDNGYGVEQCNFSALTLKHFTSKLEEFSDLQSVTTLGFRGEALSSLCALSNLTILTRHKSVECGTKIEYDKNGHIKSQTLCPRQVGTTVTLTNLFSTLPVRHKEFIKNLKREFTKMCQLLYAYCLIAEGVRIVCTNQTKKGPRTTIVSTQGTKNVRDNIVSVFGLKQLESVIEIQLHEPDEQILEDFGLKKPPGDELLFTFGGFISKCTHGSGRSASDRQFYFVNSRPCEPTKIMRLVNEVYKYFNGNQYPFVFLNIKALQSQVDINVTPDKRQIFLEQEKLLLATLKTSLLEMFKDFPSTLRMQNLSVSGETSTRSEEKKKSVAEVLKQWTLSHDKILTSQNARGLKRNPETSPPAPKPKGVMGYIYEKRIKIDEDTKQELSEDSASEDEQKQVEIFVKESYNSSDSEPEFSPVKNRPHSTENRNLKKYGIDIYSTETQNLDVDNSPKSYQMEMESVCYKITIENPEPAAKIKNAGIFGADYESQSSGYKSGVDSEELNLRDSESINDANMEKSAFAVTVEHRPHEKSENLTAFTMDFKDSNMSCSGTKKLNRVKEELDFEELNQSYESDVEKTSYEIGAKNPDSESVKATGKNSKVDNLKKYSRQYKSTTKEDSEFELTSGAKTECPKSVTTDENKSQIHDSNQSKNQNVVIDINIEEIKNLFNKIHSCEVKNSTETVVKFRSELASKTAESELEKHITKDMFEKMSIIGQFNKGFIITKLNSDIFIIDQHATDEKYNFETLQQTTVLQNQQLVNPKPLDLTAANELLLIDNIDVFKKNGFTFSIDETAEPRKKVALTAIPFSKNWEFGKEDIDELLFMLQEDSSYKNYRPLRVRAMFASRACRKSVMIGSALSLGDMRQLVNHMGQIEQPWNCPHGRPTMRHLINLDLIGK